MIVRQGKQRTRAMILEFPLLALLLDAGTRKGAKSEPLAVLIRNEKGEIFAGIYDMDSNASPEEEDPDKADAAAYLRCVKHIFECLTFHGMFWYHILLLWCRMALLPCGPLLIC